MEDRESWTDPSLPRAVLTGLAAIDAIVRIRTEARRIANRAEDLRRYTATEEGAEEYRRIQELALRLAGMAALASMLPNPPSPAPQGRWALFMAFVRG